MAQSIRAWNLKGLGLDSSWGLRIFSLSHTHDKTKSFSSFSLCFKFGAFLVFPLIFTYIPGTYEKTTFSYL